MDFSLRRIAFREIGGWSVDDVTKSFAAFRRSAVHALTEKPYRTGSLGVSHQDFAAIYQAAVAASADLGPDQARAFFEAWFAPFVIEPMADRSGHVTAFYEPVVEVSDRPDADYLYPFLAPPPDLVRLDDLDTPPEGIPPGYAYALARGDRFGVCPDRRAIEEGAFAGAGLEIAFAKSRVDVFFAHVQGAARLFYRDGRTSRLTYAAKSGHPFSGIGGVLVARGEISRADSSMQSIRHWLATHAEEAEALMWENRSFIFFRPAPVDDPDLGPVAAAKVPLEPGRSMAVDRLIHTFSTPFFVSAPSLVDFDAPQPFARLMIAQDTGTAIVGPARGDLFTGSGNVAGDKAGAVNVDAVFTVLLPSGIEPARLPGHG